MVEIWVLSLIINIIATNYPIIYANNVLLYNNIHFPVAAIQ